MIDTTVFIDYFRKKNKSNSLFYDVSVHYRIATSAICYFEICAGAKEKDVEFLNTLFQKMNILSFSTAEAKKAAQLYQMLRRNNKLVEFRDLFIAATALFHDLTLVTLNQKHFTRIPGLKIYPV